MSSPRPHAHTAVIAGLTESRAVESVQDAAFAGVDRATRTAVEQALRHLVTESLSAPLDGDPPVHRPRRRRGH